MRPLLALLALLTGCPATEIVERGAVTVCLDGGRPSGDDDVDLAISGTVTAVGAATADCGPSVTVEDAAGAATTVALRVTDAAAADITPPIDVAIGDAVELVYRWRLVWGDVAGFVLSDDGGLVVAAEEGGWGGALEAGDVPGLTVRRGDAPVASEASSCQPREAFELVFEADDTVTLVAVDSAPVTIAGVAATALAVAVWDYGESEGCQISDGTGYTSWVVHR